METERDRYSVRPDTREDGTHLSTNLGETGKAPWIMPRCLPPRSGWLSIFFGGFWKWLSNEVSLSLPRTAYPVGRRRPCRGAPRVRASLRKLGPTAGPAGKEKRGQRRLPLLKHRGGQLAKPPTTPSPRW